MKILVYRYGSICEPDVIECLKKLGHSVFEIREEITNKDLTPQEQLRLLSESLLAGSYDGVFTINFYPVLSEVCNVFKIPYFCWIVDSPVMELYSHAIRNKWNRIFLFDYAMYEEFSPKNLECIFYLPLAANHRRLDKVINTISANDRKKFSAEVSFIGSLYTEKCPYNLLKQTDSWLKGYLDGVIEAQLKVYGYNFLEECITDDVLKKFKKEVPFYQFPEKADANEKAVMAQFYLGNKVTEQERLRLLKSVSEQFSLSLYTGSDISMLPKVKNCGLAESLTEMPKIFHLSKINLNFTSKPIRTGLPQRIWDIMAAGGFVLSNFQTEIPEYFEIGTDIETFASEEELLDKIGYYLEHEEERQTIARNGYLKAKENYSLEKRVEQIFGSAF